MSGWHSRERLNSADESLIDESLIDESLVDESLVERLDLNEHDQQRLASILDGFLIAREEGRPISQSQILSDNPDLAQILAEYFADLRLLANLIPHSVSAESMIIAAPRQLADYEIGTEIGRGSMGVVYRATQKSLGRCVAIKVLSSSGALDEDRVARFQREAHITAALDHPGVVKVFDVGNEAGTYFYVMQWIDGYSLDRHIDWAKPDAPPDPTTFRTNDRNQSLPMHPIVPAEDASRQAIESSLFGGPNRFRKAAGLIQAAAEAMHAVHLSGVVHRDLKPSNLIVDRQGNLKVTDFGLARLDYQSHLTRSGELIGTVRYMSPEQAAGRSSLVDARTDVYALGATLYELCTLMPAFPNEGYPDLIQAICRGEPTSPRKIVLSLPRDLQTIIQKAMRSDQSARYQSAAALADDLGRFLSGQPILAKRRGLPEQALAWASRNAAALLSIVIVLSVGLIGALAHAARLTAEKRRTEQAVLAADQMYLHARAAVDSLGTRVANRLAEIPEAQPLRREVLAQTLSYYEEFISNASHDAALDDEVAQTKLQVARVVRQFGNFEDSASAYRVAIEALKACAPNASHRAYHVWTMAVNELAMLHCEHGDQTESLQLLQSITLDHLPPDALATTHNNLGVVMLRLGRTKDALEAVRRAVQILDSSDRAAFQPESWAFSSDLTDSLNNLAIILDAQGQSPAALEVSAQVVKLRQLAVEQANSDWRTTERLATARNNIAALHWRAGHETEAIEEYREVVHLLEAASKSSPSLVQLRTRLAIALNNLGMVATSATNYSTAQIALRRAEKIADAEFQSDTSNAEAASHLAGIQNNLGILLDKMNLRQDSRDMFTRALKHQTIAVELEPDSKPYRRSLEQVRLSFSSRDSK